jgi:copper chaperone CopZ
LGQSPLAGLPVHSLREIIYSIKYKETEMKKSLIPVQKEFCAECSLAITRFMRKLEGVESVEAESGAVAITFDETKIGQEQVEKIARENIEKLGYKTFS